MLNSITALEKREQYHHAKAVVFSTDTKIRRYHQKAERHYHILVTQARQALDVAMAHITERQQPDLVDSGGCNLDHDLSYLLEHSAFRGMIQLALNTCQQCSGTGQVWSRVSSKLHRKGFHPCNCVYRRVFTICLHKYIDISIIGSPVVTFERSHGPYCEMIGRDYMIDFEQLARFLPKYLQDIFYFHFLMGLDWRACLRVIPRWFHLCQRSGRYQESESYPGSLSRGWFFHHVYTLQEHMGWLLLAHRLFPFGSYFSGHTVSSVNQHNHSYYYEHVQSQAHYGEWQNDPWLNGGYWRDSYYGAIWLEDRHHYWDAVERRQQVKEMA